MSDIGATDLLAEVPELVAQLCDEFEAWLREDGGYLELEARHIVRACLIQAKAVVAESQDTGRIGAPDRESRIRGPVAQMIQQILAGADYSIKGRTLIVAGVTVDPITDAEFDAAYDAMDEVAMGES